MRIEVLWNCHGQESLMAQTVVTQVSVPVVELKVFSAERTSFQLYFHTRARESIGFEARSWSEAQSRLEFSLLPQLRGLGITNPEITIDGSALFDFATAHEFAVALLRESIQEAVQDLRSGRRFFRNRQTERVIAHLERAFRMYLPSRM